ncbi:MAG: hemolysin III family protein [Opitutaceae bacterium]|nr:hemolysin III family protein [Opitutaceae bacterium]
MVPSSNPPPAKHEEFSLPLFTVTLLATLAGLFALLYWLAPATWTQQFIAPIWMGVAAFLAISLVNCFVEYFFHRYVLHLPAIPFLRRLYRQHTLHHSLTRIGRRTTRGGRGLLFIENKFPIVEPEQGEASFFPWYSLTIFAAVLTPLLALLQWLLPAFPWFLAGYLALACSLTLYEVLHAINHWPMDVWEPLVEHPRWGWFWQPVYGFHLRHHAVIDCNESISGFFGLPIADWTLGTCVIPQTLYADGEEWTQDKFVSPKPVGLIRFCDRWAQSVVDRRRARAASDEVAVPEVQERPYSRGERIALWTTHGVGLASSIAGLTLLIVFSSLRGNAWHVVSFTIFGVSLLLLYAAYTRYYLRRDLGKAQVGRRLSIAALFLLAAGTSTPFLLANLREAGGWSWFAVVWAVSLAGALAQIWVGDRRSRLTTGLAVLCGGAIASAAVMPLLTTIPMGAWLLLLGGVVSYGIGMLFHRWYSLRYHHAVWNAFMVGGSTCHLLAVLLFLLPRHVA